MNGVIRQAMTVLFGRSLSRAAQLVAFIVLARALTPAEFGWFGVLTTAISLSATIGTLGLRQSFAYRIGQKEMTVGEATGTTFAVWGPLTALSTGVIAWLYGAKIPGLTTLESSGLIAAGVAGTIALTLLQGVHLGTGNIRAFALSESSPRVLLLLSALGLVVTAHATLRSTLWAQNLSVLVAIPFVIYGIMRTGPKVRIRFRGLSAMLRYGIIFALNLFLIMLCARLSVFIIEHYWGAETAGNFFAAVRLNEIFLEAAAALGMVLFSEAARQDPSLSGILRSVRIGCWLFWFFLLASGVAFLLAPWLTSGMLGSDYAGSTTALRILALSLAPAAASKVVYPTLAGHGRPLFGTPVVVASLLANAGVAFALVPSMGAGGGAVALVVGQYLLYIGYAVTIRLVYGIKVREFFVPRIADVEQGADAQPVGENSSPSLDEHPTAGSL